MADHDQQLHTVKAYQAELERLSAMIAKMGGFAEEQLARAIRSVVKRDSRLAQEVVAEDIRIDDLEGQVEQLAVRVIALRQPMAVDLREIVAAMRISIELERIGDLAKNIAKRAQTINVETPFPNLFAIDRIGAEAIRQVHQVISAYAARDVEMALAVWRRDQTLDELYNSLFRELLTYMMEDPRTIGRATHLLFVGKNLERIGDHATNIAETVHYLVTGRPLAGERPKADTTATEGVAGLAGGGKG
ncbi:phosphate signaling complex protein PhoU [Futiania mangrovi]|uniref:Phosphate-specific transport system accessory protein PhoU n=1 Tax=Futiania mangrovi TaxID=2959716 RepID=A0A9J6PD33_9PROT|nr:phosphate signaling complex protein PhoU [Futiania mangrovii]MCP1336230.1 phosphate signaling complex protein PhoU [Futiania mangrovii]